MMTDAQMRMMIGSAADAYIYGVASPAPMGTTFVRGIDSLSTGAHAQIYQINGTGE